MRIRPHCGSILQAGTCQISSLAENPRGSRVWQYLDYNFISHLKFSTDNFSEIKKKSIVSKLFREGSSIKKQKKQSGPIWTIHAQLGPIRTNPYYTGPIRTKRTKRDTSKQQRTLQDHIQDHAGLCRTMWDHAAMQLHLGSYRTLKDQFWLVLDKSGQT